MITSIYYARLASMRLEHSVCRGSIMTTYIYFLIPFKWYEHPQNSLLINNFLLGNRG